MTTNKDAQLIVTALYEISHQLGEIKREIESLHRTIDVKP